MRIGTSIFLIAVGAIMTFAVEVDRTNDFNLNTAGVILMVVGAIGLLLFSAMTMSPRRRRAVVERQPGRTVVTEDIA